MLLSTIDPVDPRQDRLDDAVSRLRAGALFALPTETFYGLCADSGNPIALGRLNRLKGKSERAPILLLAADTAQARALGAGLTGTFDLLARTFWPGPLTLVVPAAPGLDEAITGGGTTVAVRVPGLSLPRRIARHLGRAISGSSANRHGEPPCRTATEVASAFPSGLDGLLDGGPAPGGGPSTIVDLSGERPRILREGIVPAQALRPFLPHLDHPL